MLQLAPGLPRLLLALCMLGKSHLACSVHPAILLHAAVTLLLFAGVEVPLPPTYRLDLAGVASFQDYVKWMMGKNARRNWRLRQQK